MAACTLGRPELLCGGRRSRPRLCHLCPRGRMHIEQVMESTEELSAALARLVPQLSPGSEPPTPEHLRRLVEHHGCTLLVARAEGPRTPIVGTLTLVVVPIPTGVRAWIEDVVVDAGARGRGVGEALLREALRRAREAGAQHANLTSNPARAAANRLYQRLGFQKRDTNAYRFDLEARGGAIG